MKKVLGLFVLAMMVVLPMNTKAAEIVSPVTLSCGTENWDTGTKECKVMMNFDRAKKLNLPTNEAKITVGSYNENAITFGKVVGANGWEVVPKANGKGEYDLTFASAVSSESGEKQIGTITMNVKRVGADEKCAFYYIPCISTECFPKKDVGEDNTCKIVNGTYYGKNGTVVTKDVYEAECANNPQTGNFVPYAVIIAGIVLAVGVFTISRRNTKLYKI